jgi:hypothetical protein
MVHSRSETNLNRIFLDLCTSPEIRRKHGQQENTQRQYHPPLPSLKPIKSNSCSNINEVSQTFDESLLFDSDQIEQNNTLDLETLQPTSPMQNVSIESSPQSTAVPLVPIESTGFTVPATSISTHCSLKLFETLSINHTKKSSSHKPTRQETKKNKSSSLLPNSATTSQDLPQHDFLNRLQDRLKSREHLRKFFLS